MAMEKGGSTNYSSRARTRRQMQPSMHSHAHARMRMGVGVLQANRQLPAASLDLGGGRRNLHTSQSTANVMGGEGAGWECDPWAARTTA